MASLSVPNCCCCEGRVGGWVRCVPVWSPKVRGGLCPPFVFLPLGAGVSCMCVMCMRACARAAGRRGKEGSEEERGHAAGMPRAPQGEEPPALSSLLIRPALSREKRRGVFFSATTEAGACCCAPPPPPSLPPAERPRGRKQGGGWGCVCVLCCPGRVCVCVCVCLCGRGATGGGRCAGWLRRQGVGWGGGARGGGGGERERERAPARRPPATRGALSQPRDVALSLSAARWCPPPVPTAAPIPTHSPRATRCPRPSSVAKPAKILLSSRRHRQAAPALSPRAGPCWRAPLPHHRCRSTKSSRQTTRSRTTRP
jgi:hypothetical protein